MDPPAALATQGSLKVGGGSSVNGYDTIPATWGAVCDSSDMTDKPGIMIDDSTTITTNGAKFEVAGNPAVQQDTTITAESLLSFGDMGWSDIVAMAEKTYPVGASTLNDVQPDSLLTNGHYVCRTSTQDNWGDPVHPSGACGNYFPIIYAAGDLHITGGYGQGILLVEGDLAVQGGFEFYGPVFVKGELSTAGYRGPLQRRRGGGQREPRAPARCWETRWFHIRAARSHAPILGNSALTKVRPLAMRSWVDLSGVVGG